MYLLIHTENGQNLNNFLRVYMTHSFALNSVYRLYSSKDGITIKQTKMYDNNRLNYDFILF